MFLQELNPIFEEFTKEPLAFVNGFVAGALRLNLDQDPLKSWLEQQGFDPTTKNNNGNQPKSISIS